LKKILFVDDEKNVLEGLKRLLRPMRHEWQTEFVESGSAALEKLSAEPFDVIVSDMRMPGMSGAALLREVKLRHPNIVRIILSGQSDRDDILQSLVPTHQYLSKPCDIEALKWVIGRACNLRTLLENGDLRILASRMVALPCEPDLLQSIREGLSDPDTLLRTTTNRIAREMGVTAKLLQLVSSSYFGSATNILHPIQAAELLGRDILHELVFSDEIFASASDSNPGGEDLVPLRNHSLRVAKMAEMIAKRMDMDECSVQAAYTGGLLHDAGRLALAANLPEQYRYAARLAKEHHRPLIETEREVFGATHTEIGAFLLGLWGLPESIIEAVAYHHTPGKHETCGILPAGLVHIADSLDHRLHPNYAEGIGGNLDEQYAVERGILEHISEWEEGCQAIGNPPVESCLEAAA
jgi:putative nucleotidyltransferase with HDIG domain